MAIKLTLDKNGDPAAYQEAFLPTVYLDTWAYIDIALDVSLSSEFIKILNEKNGTIFVSDYILFEICKLKSEEHFNLILNMIEKLDQAFIDLNPCYVIDRENFPNFDDSNNYISPACPQNILRAFIHDYPPFKPYNVIHAFKMIRNTPGAIEDLKTNLNFEEQLMPSIIKCREEEKCINRAKDRHASKSKMNKKHFPNTKDIYRQFMDFLVVNKDIKMPDKEWIDAFHTIVPTAYSDFVLLDNRWKSFINGTKLKPPAIASVYSKRELNDFFNDLRNFDELKKQEVIQNLIQDELIN